MKTLTFSLRCELKENHENIMSSGGPCLTLGCNRIPLAAVNSVRDKSGSRGTSEEEATAVVQVSDDSGGSGRD